MRLSPQHAVLALVFLAACTDAPAPGAPTSPVGVTRAHAEGTWVVNFDNLFDECDGDPYGCASGSIPELRFEWGGESVFPVEWARSGCCALVYGTQMSMSVDNRTSAGAAVVGVSVWVWPADDTVLVAFLEGASPASLKTRDSVAFHVTPQQWNQIEFKLRASPGAFVLAHVHSKGASAYLHFDDMTIWPAVADEAPPVIHYAQALTELWPVNHVLVPAITGIAASDDVDGAAPVAVSVESPGGAADYQIVPRADGTQDVLLRAERLGNEGDRVYRVVLSASDAAGNTATDTLRVVVPHDLGRR